MACQRSGRERVLRSWRSPWPAAQQCFRKRRTGCQAVPRGLRTEKRTSSGAAQRARRPGGEHRQQRSRTPRAAHAPPPTRQRDQRRQRCKAPGHAPRVLSASGPMAHHCRPRRHRLAAPAYRQARRHRGHVGGESTGTAAAASEWSRSETGPIAPLCCLWTISAPKKLSTPLEHLAAGPAGSYALPHRPEGSAGRSGTSQTAGPDAPALAKTLRLVSHVVALLAWPQPLAGWVLPRLWERRRAELPPAGRLGCRAGGLAAWLAGPCGSSARRREPRA
jgi:putative transposase